MWNSDYTFAGCTGMARRDWLSWRLGWGCGDISICPAVAWNGNSRRYLGERFICRDCQFTKIYIVNRSWNFWRRWLLRQFLARDAGAILKLFTCTGRSGNANGCGWTEFCCCLRCWQNWRTRPDILPVGYWAAANDFEIYFGKDSHAEEDFAIRRLLKPIGRNTLKLLPVWKVASSSHAF